MTPNRPGPLGILVLSSQRWSGPPGSMHFTAEAFCRLGHRVLWVDPPVSPMSGFRQPERWADIRGPRDEHPPGGPTVWRPVVAPGQNRAAGQALNGRWLRNGIGRRIGVPDLSLCFVPEARGVMRGLAGFRVYSCIDSLRDLPGCDRRAMEEREAALIGAVDAVVACSRPLVEQLGASGCRAAYIPHGSPSGLPDLTRRHVPAPDRLVERPRPWVGYVGSLNFRVDPAFLRASLDACGGGTLVMVGGRSGFAGPGLPEGAQELMDRPEVVAVGHRSGAELDRYLAHLDVAVVPYGLTPFNRKSYPLKIPQHLALGTPVVSSPNGATDELARHVYVAATAREFHDGVRRALDPSDMASRPGRVEAARARPWTTVASELLALPGSPLSSA